MTSFVRSNGFCQALSLCFVALAACAEPAGSAAAPADTATGAATDATGDAAPDASGDAAPQHPSLAYDAAAPGPFHVGYRTLPLTYTAPGGVGARTVTVHVWYPTDATSGAHPEPYGGILPDEDSLLDAPPSSPVAGGRYPVHVYSHGHQGFAGTSSFLCRHFASHGWLVVAPDHVGNLLSDAILPRPTWMYFARSTDVTATLDLLAKLPASDPLHGRADTARVLLSGHSFGAHTCWATGGASFDAGKIAADCQADGGAIALGDCASETSAVFAKGLRDERVVALAPMAGVLHRSLMGDHGHEPVKLPVLALSGGNDPIGAQAQFDSCTGCDLTWIELDGACHQSFALGGCPTLDKSLAFPLISRWVLAFARRHVLGDTAAATLDLLSGKLLEPLVKFARRQP